MDVSRLMILLKEAWSRVKPIFFRGRVREALWRKLRDQYLNVEAEIEIER